MTTPTNTAAANLPGTRAKGPLHAVHADQAVRAALLAFHARPADDEAAAVVAVIGAALAAPARPPVVDMSEAYAGTREDLSIWKKRALEAEELNRKFSASVNGPTFMGEPAAPALAAECPVDTGNPEADRIIGRLASSDPDFDDCTDAVALIRKLAVEHKGPDGFATWKDAAVAERVRRVEATRIQAATEHPPLPRHDWCLNCSPAMPGYTADQMRAYVDADRTARGASQAAQGGE